MNTRSIARFSLTAVVVLIAALLAHAMWRHYMYSPWTRDGRVRAEVVRIAPDVSGLVTRVAVRDNQAVKQGDLLFEIDAMRYRNAVAQAQANLAAAEAAARAAGAGINAAAAGAAERKANFEMYQAQSARRQRIQGQIISAEEQANAAAAANAALAGWNQARASGKEAGASREKALAAVEQARAALEAARLDLARTQVRAPVDGYVTNLDVRRGDYAGAGAARLALIDRHAFWIAGYFEETKLAALRVGDPVEIRLMSGGPALPGRVESIARGISDRDNPTGADLLADVNPTYNWVRLAQRVPVRIGIDEARMPAGTLLAAGMTATVVVHPRRD
ncbi:biotin/lipoyl-binding protein [Luteimonas aquatica]|uniref:biotin/lipoyl-binding protein n=1 Tax=Luteimonas aquatica TaxID=450364 RepID=UPI001F5A7E3D|nr:HlyD family secretion protein [Luteimonas aquatica]